MAPQRNQSFDTSNEEWSEILTVDTGRPLSMTVRLAPADPTPVEVDVNKALSAQDLQSLKKRDPFLYYSIPGVREASVCLKQVDMHQLAQDGLKRNCASCPASIQTVATSDNSATKVKRCTRISFECHTDLLLDDLFEDDQMKMNDLIDDHIEKCLDELSRGSVDDFLAKLLSLE